ncbi:hypothetical protein O181_037459 [Austropuccinia psidii MF-1]|uniref:Methyltransferase small domain-containing protein n=1 Tax=Austropuccinia psidii MF-1 TaxID=1389203 RepID=A0A9Q3D6K3_9BASI|nr:hypothetical protein [Austropuccinia psidii MF-1]
MSGLPAPASAASAMHPTPDLSHLMPADYEEVYEPAEDTFALLDALEADAERLVQHRPLICAEIGKQLLRDIPTLHFCIDINRVALCATISTFERNSLPLPNVIHTSLLSGLRLDRSIDLLLFNPPYVETNDDEFHVAATSGTIAASWAGGKAGMKLTDQLLANLEQILHPTRGIFYLVAVKENKPDEIIWRMQARGFCALVVLKRRAGREHLHILRISRPQAFTALQS